MQNKNELLQILILLVLGLFIYYVVWPWGKSLDASGMSQEEFWEMISKWVVFGGGLLLGLTYLVISSAVKVPADKYGIMEWHFPLSPKLPEGRNIATRIEWPNFKVIPTIKRDLYNYSEPLKKLRIDFSIGFPWFYNEDMKQEVWKTKYHYCCRWKPWPRWLRIKFRRQGTQAQILRPGWNFPFLINVFGKVEFRDMPEIPEDKRGVVIAKDGIHLRRGVMTRIHVECNHFTNAEAFLEGGGETGPQIETLSHGRKLINEKLFKIELFEKTEIGIVKRPKLGHHHEEEVDWSQIGIVTVKIGSEIPDEEDRVIALKPEPVGDYKTHDNFQDLVTWQKMGGEMGIQPQLVEPGGYYLHPYAIELEKTWATYIKEGQVGVVISNIGESPAADGSDYIEEWVQIDGKEMRVPVIKKKTDSQTGKPEYKRGITEKVLSVGFHFIHPVANQVQIVDTTPINLKWTKERQPIYNFDPVRITTKDRFYLEISVEIGIIIEGKNAAKMIAISDSEEELIRDTIHPRLNSTLVDIALKTNIDRIMNNISAFKKHIKKALDKAVEGRFASIIYLEISEIDFKKDPNAQEYLALFTREVSAKREIPVLEQEALTEGKRIEVMKQRGLADAARIKERGRALNEVTREGEGQIAASVQKLIASGSLDFSGALTAISKMLGK